MSLAMTKSEREAFLAALHVGVISISQSGHGPLTVPIWYAYQPGGELWVLTDRDSRKGKLLKIGKRISLCAQTETAPYQYVSVEGPIVAIEPSDRERDAPSDGAPLSRRRTRRSLRRSDFGRSRGGRQHRRAHAPGALAQRGLQEAVPV